MCNRVSPVVSFPLRDTIAVNQSDVTGGEDNAWVRCQGSALVSGETVVPVYDVLAIAQYMLVLNSAFQRETKHRLP